MPKYEFMCVDCGTHIEYEMSIVHDTIPLCSRCKEPMRKVFTIPGIVFKGTGWASKE
jgi:putative FmdB family regulatory protein